MKKVITLTISTILSLLILELICRSFLSLGTNYSETSIWQQEKWIENHRNSGSLLAYTIDQYDSLLGWTLKDDLSTHTMINDGLYTWSVSSNSKGCRGKEEHQYSKQNTTRILFIGDSYTFGECVSDTETIPYQTQSLMPGTEIINLAVHGYGNDQQYLKLISEGLKYSPDIVILGYNYIDVVRNHLYFRDYAKPYFKLKNNSLELKGVPVPPPDAFLTGPDIRSWSLIKANFGKYIQHISIDPTDQLTQTILENMYTACSNSKAELVVLYLPMPDECKKGEEFFPVMKDSLCIRHRLLSISPVKEIHQFILTQKDPNVHFLCHYSATINRLIARTIANKLTDRINNARTK